MKNTVLSINVTDFAVQRNGALSIEFTRKRCRGKYYVRVGRQFQFNGGSQHHLAAP